MVSLKVPNGLNFTRNFILSFTLFFLPILLFDLGFDGMQIGILISSMTFTVLLSTFPIGILNDKLSIRYIVVIGMFLESVFFFGLYAFDSFWLIACAFIAGALGGNMIETSIRGLTFKLAEKGMHGKRLGTFQFVMSTGFGLGIVVGGALLYALNFGGVLLISAAAYLILGVVSLFVVEPGKAVFPVSDYKKEILKRSTILFLLPMFIFGTHWGAENTSYSLFLREGLGLNLAWSGFYMGIPIIMLAVASLYGGKIIDSRGKSMTALVAGLLISGAGHILMTVPIVPLSFMFRIIHEIGDGFAAVGYYVCLSRLFKTERISGESGLAVSVNTLGGTVGALVFGPLGYAYGFAWPLAISGLLSIFSAIIMMVLRKRMKL